MRIVLMLILLCSCSLIEKRKDHYSYVKPGLSLDDVKKKSGEPVNESFHGNISILTYDYCRASYAKEAIYGLLTFTMYNWGCNAQMGRMHLFFKDGSLIRKDENGNAEARTVFAREMAAAMEDGEKSLAPKP